MTIDYTQPLGPRPPAPEAKTGCGTIALVGCAVFFAIFVAFIGGVFWFVFHLVKSSDIYNDALHRAQNDPRVIAVLGSPIEAKWWVLGNLNMDTEHGRARLQ